LEAPSHERATGLPRRQGPAIVPRRADLALVGAGAMPGGVRRTAGFLERLLARAQARAGRARPLEMALRRAATAGARTIVHRAGPRFVTHHHAGPRIHLRVAMQVALRASARAPVDPARTIAAPILPGPILQTVVAHPGAERGLSGPAPRRAPLPSPSSVALRPATHPAPVAPEGPRAAPAITTVVTTLRREERVRLDTVVRRTRVEVAAPPAPVTSGPAPRPSEVMERARDARRPSLPPPAAPLAVSESEIGRLADRVVQRIHRRVVTQRERMGGR
jgi:hypothetical protein